MSSENAIIQRIRALIKEGEPVSPAMKKQFSLTYDELQLIPGWIASTINVVKLLNPSNDSPYADACRTVQVRLNISHQGLSSNESNEKSECVGHLVSVLKGLLVDIESGLIPSFEDRVRGRTFDDFLEHADEYLKHGRKKEAGVIAGVVFEDTMRAIANRHQATAHKLEDTINNLARKSIITRTQAKRAKVASHVRTKATHADWKEFDIADVQETARFTREMIASHLEA